MFIDGTKLTDTRENALRFTNRKEALLVAKMESSGAFGWRLEISTRLAKKRDGYYTIAAYNTETRGAPLGYLADSRFA